MTYGINYTTKSTAIGNLTETNLINQGFVEVEEQEYIQYSNELQKEHEKQIYEKTGLTVEQQIIQQEIDNAVLFLTEKGVL